MQDNKGQFVRGVSGNAAGRPKGILDRRHRMAQAFGGEYNAVAQAVIDAAKGGDIAAAALYLSRVEPPLRPKAERVTFNLDTTQPIATQAAAVLQAVAGGDLSPDDAQLVLQCLNSLATLVQADEVMRRLADLEAAQARIAGAGRHGAGVVISKELN